MMTRAVRRVSTILSLLALAAVVGMPAVYGQEGLDSYKEVWRVFVHPRCTNCHAAGDRPTIGEQGKAHPMAVVRGEKGEGVPGLNCSACHPDITVTIRGGPPTAPHWRMPGRETKMSFAGKSEAELCAQLKNPELTGKPDLIEAIKHVLEDSLVAWSFEPGPGREAPPISKKAFFDHLAKWAKAGAPCPAP